MNKAETRAEHIDPCGYAGLCVTQACELGITVPINELQAELAQNLIHGFSPKAARAGAGFRGHLRQAGKGAGVR